MKTLLIFMTLLFISGTARDELKFRNNGTFRIAQITDVHHKLNHSNATEALTNLGIVLDKVKPDLIFFTGDIVVDQSMKQAWYEVIGLAIQRNIPWAVTFGNHDDENGSTRVEIMNYLRSLPLCLAVDGPGSVAGVGNYFLRVESSERNATAAILYALDSHSYSPETIEQEKYGYFDFSQVDWYRTVSRQLTQENNGKPYPALAFFHIPLREYGLLNDSLKYTRIGSRLETECYGALNTGMYAAMFESGDIMATFAGHDHLNDYIGRLNTICLAYGRFSGSSTTYGHLPTGIRVIELLENERAFRTWISDTVDERVYPAFFNNNRLISE